MTATASSASGGPVHGRNVSLDHLVDRARFVRLETVRLSKIAGAGHYSSTFSAAELFSALYYAHLRIDPARPDWPDRDRFILSKGHAAIGLYPVLGDLGFFDPALLDNYTRLGSPFGDHPDMKKVPGIDFSSGSLGHGLSIGVGMALAGRMQNRSYRVYCMLGDGELNEGADLGGGDVGRPLQAAGPRRHRRPQQAVHRRSGRPDHGGRAAGRTASRASAGRCSASTATTCRRSSPRSTPCSRPARASRR
jgi:hypothetical protein